MQVATLSEDDFARHLDSLALATPNFKPKYSAAYARSRSGSDSFSISLYPSPPQSSWSNASFSQRFESRPTTASPLSPLNDKREKGHQQLPPVGPADESNYPSGTKLILIMISLYLSMFLVALDRTIIATAIPDITNTFDSFDDIGWYGSAYLLTFCAFQLTLGRVYTFYPAKWVFLVCIAVFEIGSAICGAAPTSTALIWGRAIAGLGSAGIQNGATILTIHAVPLSKRPIFQGLFAAVFGVSSVLGPLLGGAFTTELTWRWCFYLNLPIGLVTILVLVFLVSTPPPIAAHTPWRRQVAMLDPFGTAMLIPSIVCLILALQWGGSTYPWSNPRIIVLLILSAIFFAVFTAIQILRPDTATIPPRLLTQRSLIGSLWYVFTLSSSMLVVIYYLPLYFQAVRGSSAVQSGIQNLPMLLSMVVSAILIGAVVQRTGYYVPPMYVGTVIMCLGAGLLCTLQVHSPSGAWIGFQIIYGLGLGIGMMQPTIAVQTVSAPKDVSTATALVFFAQTLGSSVFVSVGQNLLSTRFVAELIPLKIPGLDPVKIVAAGATDLRSAVPPSALEAVLVAYNNALRSVFYAATGLACLTIFGVVLMEWIDIRQVKEKRLGGGGGGKGGGTGGGAERGHETGLDSLKETTKENEKEDEKIRIVRITATTLDA